MIFEAYCVGKVHNMLPSSIILDGAYCVVNAHNMLPWVNYDIGSILCRQRTQYATFVVL